MRTLTTFYASGRLHALRRHSFAIFRAKFAVSWRVFASCRTMSADALDILFSIISLYLLFHFSSWTCYLEKNFGAMYFKTNNVVIRLCELVLRRIGLCVFGGNFTTVAWSARPHTSVFRPPTSFFRTTFLYVVCFKLSAPLTNAAIVYDESTDRKSPYTRYTAPERPLQKTHRRRQF